jgi:hypothetical protein
LNRLLDWKLDRLRIPHIMLRRALGLLLFSGSCRIRPDFGIPPYPPLDRPAQDFGGHSAINAANLVKANALY